MAGVRKDLAVHLWDAHAPIHSSPAQEGLSKLLALAPGAPLLLDVPYADREEEFLDVMALKQWPD